MKKFTTILLAVLAVLSFSACEEPELIEPVSTTCYISLDLFEEGDFSYANLFDATFTNKDTGRVYEFIQYSLWDRPKLDSGNYKYSIRFWNPDISDEILHIAEGEFKADENNYHLKIVFPVISVKIPVQVNGVPYGTEKISLSFRTENADDDPIEFSYAVGDAMAPVIPLKEYNVEAKALDGTGKVLASGIGHRNKYDSGKLKYEINLEESVCTVKMKLKVNLSGFDENDIMYRIRISNGELTITDSGKKYLDEKDVIFAIGNLPECEWSVTISVLEKNKTIKEETRTYALEKGQIKTDVFDFGEISHTITENPVLTVNLTGLDELLKEEEFGTYEIRILEEDGSIWSKSKYSKGSPVHQASWYVRAGKKYTAVFIPYDRYGIEIGDESRVPVSIDGKENSVDIPVSKIRPVPVSFFIKDTENFNDWTIPGAVYTISVGEIGDSYNALEEIGKWKTDLFPGAYTLNLKCIKDGNEEWSRKWNFDVTRKKGNDWSINLGPVSWTIEARVKGFEEGGDLPLPENIVSYAFETNTGKKKTVLRADGNSVTFEGRGRSRIDITASALDSTGHAIYRTVMEEINMEGGMHETLDFNFLPVKSGIEVKVGSYRQNDGEPEYSRTVIRISDEATGNVVGEKEILSGEPRRAMFILDSGKYRVEAESYDSDGVQIWEIEDTYSVNEGFHSLQFNETHESYNKIYPIETPWSDSYGRAADSFTYHVDGSSYGYWYLGRHVVTGTAWLGDTVIGRASMPVDFSWSEKAPEFSIPYTDSTTDIILMDEWNKVPGGTLECTMTNTFGAAKMTGVSGADGTVEIKDVPAGTWNMEIKIVKDGITYGTMTDDNFFVSGSKDRETWYCRNFERAYGNVRLILPQMRKMDISAEFVDEDGDVKVLNEYDVASDGTKEMVYGLKYGSYRFTLHLTSDRNGYGTIKGTCNVVPGETVDAVIGSVELQDSAINASIAPINANRYPIEGILRVKDESGVTIKEIELYYEHGWTFTQLAAGTYTVEFEVTDWNRVEEPLYIAETVVLGSSEDKSVTLVPSAPKQTVSFDISKYAAEAFRQGISTATMTLAGPYGNSNKEINLSASSKNIVEELESGFWTMTLESGNILKQRNKIKVMSSGITELEPPYFKMHPNAYRILVMNDPEFPVDPAVEFWDIGLYDTAGNLLGMEKRFPNNHNYMDLEQEGLGERVIKITGLDSDLIPIMRAEVSDNMTEPGEKDIRAVATQIKCALHITPQFNGVSLENWFNNRYTVTHRAGDEHVFTSERWASVDTEALFRPGKWTIRTDLLDTKGNVLHSQSEEFDVYEVASPIKVRPVISTGYGKAEIMLDMEESILDEGQKIVVSIYDVSYSDLLETDMVTNGKIYVKNIPTGDVALCVMVIGPYNTPLGYEVINTSFNPGETKDFSVRIHPKDVDVSFIPGMGTEDIVKYGITLHDDSVIRYEITEYPVPEGTPHEKHTVKAGIYNMDVKGFDSDGRLIYQYTSILSVSAMEDLHMEELEANKPDASVTFNIRSDNPAVAGFDINLIQGMQSWSEKQDGSNPLKLTKALTPGDWDVSVVAYDSASNPLEKKDMTFHFGIGANEASIKTSSLTSRIEIEEPRGDWILNNAWRIDRLRLLVNLDGREEVLWEGPNASPLYLLIDTYTSPTASYRLEYLDVQGAVIGAADFGQVATEWDSKAYAGLNIPAEERASFSIVLDTSALGAGPYQGKLIFYPVGGSSYEIAFTDSSVPVRQEGYRPEAFYIEALCLSPAGTTIGKGSCSMTVDSGRDKKISIKVNPATESSGKAGKSGEKGGRI